MVEGCMVGIGVCVGVGGNQTMVGVGVRVAVDVIVGGTGIGVVGRQAANIRDNNINWKGINTLHLQTTLVDICYAVRIITCSRSGPTDMVRTGIPAISSIF